MVETSLVITVGRQDAQINGSDDRAIQAGIDYLSALGGGTLKILPGQYQLNNAIYLRNRILIQGSGSETVLIKNPSLQTTLTVDSDWYDREVKVANSRGLEVGYGVCLTAQSPHHTGSNVIKRTILAKDGNCLWLNRPLEQNFWSDHQAQLSTLFPIISGEGISKVEIRDLVLDGNKSNNQNLNGNYGGCIFMQNCHQIQIDNVEVRNYNGDGISWQICHDVKVTNCRSLNNADLGLHPGSGSQRPIIKNNRVAGNQIGLFFCWGVKHGVAENNHLSDSGKYGISIGHRDTDNTIISNRIENSGEVGILFRQEPNRGRCPHRNLVKNNDIINSGSNGQGIGVNIEGETESIHLQQNQITEKRSQPESVGIRIGPNTRDIVLSDNRFLGLTAEVEDLRSGPE